MGPHLYILRFRDGLHFKLGISLVSNMNRIMKHNSTYGIDLDNSFIVSCDSSTGISLLEKNLKHLTSEVILEDSPYYGLDGYTEIRSNDQLSEVMDIIEIFKPRLGLDITTLHSLDLCKLDKKVKSVDKHKGSDGILSIYSIDNNVSLLGLESLVGILLDNLISVSRFNCEFRGDDYIELRVNLSEEFVTYKDLSIFLEGIDISFRLFYNGGFRVIRMTPEVEVIFGDFDIVDSSEFFGVIFRFRRYFRDSDLFVLDNSGVLDSYNSQMELLLCNKN